MSEKVDIFAQLPIEMVEHVCSYLTPKDLKQCSSVSKLWREKILSLDSVWRNICRQKGLIRRFNFSLPDDYSLSPPCGWASTYLCYKKQRIANWIHNTPQKVTLNFNVNVSATYASDDTLVVLVDVTDFTDLVVWDIRTTPEPMYLQTISLPTNAGLRFYNICLYKDFMVCFQYPYVTLLLKPPGEVQYAFVGRIYIEYGTLKFNPLFTMDGVHLGSCEEIMTGGVYNGSLYLVVEDGVFFWSLETASLLNVVQDEYVDDQWTDKEYLFMRNSSYLGVRNSKSELVFSRKISPASELVVDAKANTNFVATVVKANILQYHLEISKISDPLNVRVISLPGPVSDLIMSPGGMITFAGKGNPVNIYRINCNSEAPELEIFPTNISSLELSSTRIIFLDDSDLIAMLYPQDGSLHLYVYQFSCQSSIYNARIGSSSAELIHFSKRMLVYHTDAVFWEIVNYVC